MLVDIEAHMNDEFHLDEKEQYKAMADSVMHELRHAIQEINEWDLDEDEAEHSSDRMPF
jgi:hypothetical protein